MTFSPQEKQAKGAPVRRISPPFTERHSFTGPTTALSCEVTWSDEAAGYVARSEHGWVGFSDLTADAAALALFRGWVTGEQTPSVCWFEDHR